MTTPDLSVVLARLAALEAAAGLDTPELFALPGTVAPGEIIESAWGNSVSAELVAARSVALRQASQSIAGGQQVAFAWPTEIVDNGNWHPAGGSSLTCPLGGLYAFVLTAGINSGTVTAACDVVLNINGTLLAQPIITGKSAATMAVVAQLNAGNTVEGRLYNGTAAAAFFNAGLTISYVRAVG